MAERREALEAARSAYAEHRWADARAAFLALRAQDQLVARDMEALAETAWWEGAIDESLSAYEEAYRLYLHGDDPARDNATEVIAITPCPCPPCRRRRAHRQGRRSQIKPGPTLSWY